MYLQSIADEICEFLLGVEEVKSCSICGSIANGTHDKYSDIDIEIDVSGIDNSIFITQLPKIFSKKYDVVFADYAPSLAPEKYVISIAISSDNPFLLIDICCTATPPYTTMSKGELSALNNHYTHTLKLFSSNLKHYIRGIECYDDIEKMYSRIFDKNIKIADEYEMLNKVFEWLQNNAERKHKDFVTSFKAYLYP